MSGNPSGTVKQFAKQRVLVKQLYVDGEEVAGSSVVPVTASRTLALTDNNDILESKNGATEVVLTIPPRSSVDFGGRGRINLVQVDAGNCTVDPGAGVTLNGGTANISLAAQFSAGTLYERGLNDWILVGSLA